MVSVWPVWGGRWRWTARRNAVKTASGYAPTRGQALTEANQALRKL